MNKKNIRMAGIILGGVFIWMLLGLFAPSERKPEIRDVEKQTVLTINSEAQDYSLPISIQSISEAFSKVELRSQTSEKVKKINFLDGEFVEKDQVICELEPGQKYANFKKSEIQYESSKNLFDKGLISESGLVTSEASYEAAKVDYERTKIKATFNGFVEKLAKEGQLLQNGQLCASLISLSPLKIVGNVSELLVNKVKIGQNVNVTFLSGEGYKSNLTFISSSADKQTKTFQVETEIENVSNFIKDGLTGTMTIFTDPEKAHFVPTSAFLLADNGNVSLALVTEGKIEIVVVNILRDTIEGAWVSGLPNLSRIVVAGQGFVTQGEEVNFKDK